MELHSREQLIHIVPELAAREECGWVEFKVGNEDPQTIGENISALANSARLADQPFGYIVWGVRDSDREIVGTQADPESQKKGNADLTNWLSTQLNPPIHFEFRTVKVGEIRLVVLTLEAASFQPVQFRGVEYVRVGSYTKPLSRHPDYARRLWRSFDQEPFELATALDRLAVDEVLALLDYSSYFDLMHRPLPESRTGILEALLAEDFIARMPGTGWRITNLGALLLAKNIENFPTLRRKALRVIQYRGTNKVEQIKEQVGARGYANGFEGLIGYINGVLPANPVIGQALRETAPVYPELAVRELVANALIHQDFAASGAGPMIEIYEDRIEISNPGAPLVPVDRLVDAPPRSRNERLAFVLRRMGICEEQGSGWDKVAFQVEFYQLPAPIVRTSAGSTQVTMLSPRELRQMTRDDKLRAVYLHACIREISNEHTTNSSVRHRFGIAEKNKAAASRLLGDAVKAGVIVPHDPDAAVRLMRYVPFWAASEQPSQTKFVDG